MQCIEYWCWSVPPLQMKRLLLWNSNLSFQDYWHEFLTSLGNSGLCWTVFSRNRDTAVRAEGNGDLQTLICVLVARPIRYLTLLNPVPWQNWMAAYLGYTLRMKTLFHGWPVMAHATHTRRRRLTHWHGQLEAVTVPLSSHALLLAVSVKSFSVQVLHKSVAMC